MGMLKNHMIHISELASGVADEIAVGAGARSRCECGGTRDEGMWADVPEYVEGLYVNGDSRVAGVDKDDLLEALDYLKENGDQECPCQIAMGKD